jgi:outer membrane protein assembly factor BamB
MTESAGWSWGRGIRSARRAGRWALLAGVALGVAAGGASANGAAPQELLYFTAREQLRRIDLDTIDPGPIVEDTLIASTGDDAHALPGPRGGGNVNGKICVLPNGDLTMSEDAGQEKGYPAGVGVFKPDGKMVGKLVFTALAGFSDPTGCAVDVAGRLFTLEAGNEGVGGRNGQLILWFPPYERFPGTTKYPNAAYSTNYCKIAVDIGTATNVAVDDQGRLLVTSPSQASVFRYSGSWPTSPDATGGCGRTDPTGAPLVDAGRITKETFISDGGHVATPSGLARAPNGDWYVGDVLFGRIAEYDAQGQFVRMIMDSSPVAALPTRYGNPQSIAVDSRGTLYYADLDLVGSLFTPDTGPDGKIWRVRFDAHGNPLTPEVLERGLGFPDGVSVLPGNLEPTQWRTLGGGPSRLYFNPTESTITPANVAQLVTRWSFPTAAIVTSSPTVAFVNVPGEGRVQTVFFQDWDGHVYAVRLSDGTLLWTFQADVQPGASYPGAGSATVEEVDGAEFVLIGSGETLYALDAGTGQEVWQFVAGTGCRDALGDPPGLCSFTGERNEIESTPLVVGDLAYFGMDVNDDATGKGGIYAVDVHTGRMRWYFDPESGSTCRPDVGDGVTHFDGYHDEAELGLPAGFLSSRIGCDFDRTPTGCSNVWSSFSTDLGRGLLFTASANCDTDSDPATPEPPTLSPWNDAIFALDLDGDPVWHWRPPVFTARDPDFGAVPNLFTIHTASGDRDVVGVGGKDGTYYVIDRDGVNAASGVAWNSADPSGLPYWSTQVVPGGALGGIIASAAVDQDARRIYFSTAPGDTQPDVYNPQRPTMHALDMDTGAILWDNGTTSGFDGDASFAPTSAIPGVVFTGAVLEPLLRAWDAATGALLYSQVISSPVASNAIASAATVVDGTLLVGTGVGTRTGNPDDLSDKASRQHRALVAMCVPGTRGCGACDNGIDDDHDGYTDYPDDPGCTSPDDPSEKSVDIACDDGIDNDGDGKIDMLDPGCASPAQTTETTECDDGIDNDGNGLVDFADPKCTRQWPFWEERPSCGLGFELALLVPALEWARRRRRSRSHG